MSNLRQDIKLTFRCKACDKNVYPSEVFCGWECREKTVYPDGVPFATVTNDEGRTFNVTLKRDRSSMNLGPVVAFFDDTYANQKIWGPLGQPVSSYYLQTLDAHGASRGLCLDGGIPEWNVTGANLEEILAVVPRG